MQDASANRQFQVAQKAQVRVRTAAKALVSTEEGVLLIKESHDDGTPFWTLPGGGLSEGESVLEGLTRELEEEVGTMGEIRNPVTSFVYKHRSLPNTLSRYTVYWCELESEPSPNPGEGILEQRWVEPADPPGRTLPQVRWLLKEIE